MNISQLKDKKINESKKMFIIYFLGTFLFCTGITSLFFKIEIVKGISMYPTLKDKTVEFSIKTNYTKVERGDIVNIDSSTVGENIVKRVIGIEGDKIEVVEGTLYVNGERIEEPYLNQVEGFSDTFSIVVPKAHIYVMGDNRGYSLDSRKIGTIPMNEIKSKLLFTLGK